MSIDYVTTLDELVGAQRWPTDAASGPDVVLVAPDFDLGTVDERVSERLLRWKDNGKGRRR